MFTAPARLAGWWQNLISLFWLKGKKKNLNTTFTSEYIWSALLTGKWAKVIIIVSPWCWPPTEIRFFIGGEAQRWATALLRTEEPGQRVRASFLISVRRQKLRAGNMPRPESWVFFPQTHKASNFSRITSKKTRVQNRSYIQKLRPLGEAHRIVSSLQLGVLSQLIAHHGHLLIHIWEKPIFCVLQEEKHEKFKSQVTD